MILKSINKNVDKFGFPETLEYNNDKFHGHQKGIAICVKDNKTNKFIENFLSKNLGDDSTRDFLLNDLLQDPEILLIEDNITQLVNDELVPRTVYYIPYFVENHSCLQPTINFNNISGACNVSYEIKVELLFATYDGLNRYMVVDFNTTNTPIFDLVNDIFDEELPDVVYNENGEDGPGYYLDFYDEAGQVYHVCVNRYEDFKDLLVSFRLIELKMEINDGK